MTITAQIFSNYVLMPPRRRPDGSTRPAAPHGSALLVFADERAKKVQLRTGYSSRVAGHPRLHTRKVGRDEIVSLHTSPLLALKQFCIWSFWYFVAGGSALAAYAFYHANHF
jgi:hypothetical protein